MFYGWRMVGVAFGAQMVASGLGFYALPRLLQPLADEFASGARAEVAALTAAMSLPGIVVGPAVGRAVARYGVRRMMPVGALAMAAGFAALTQATALWHFYAVYVLAVPFAVGTLSSVGANALVGSWFDRKRPIAIGVSQFGMSIAGAVCVFFISWTLGIGGWRTSYLGFALVAAVSAPLLFLLIRDRPEDLGLHADGAAAPRPTPVHHGDWTLREALRDRNLWYAGVASGLCFFGSTGILQNAHALASDGGYSTGQADTLLATLALGAALGKLVFGWLGVRFGERASFSIAIAAQTALLAAMPSTQEVYAGLISSGLGLGMALGGIMPGLSALLARLYGAVRFGPAMGYVAPIMIPFQMSGAFVAARIFDTTGSYDGAFYGFAIAGVAAGTLVLRIRFPSASAPND